MFLFVPLPWCQCTNIGALLLTPLLVHGQSEPCAAATLSRLEEGSQREVEAKDNQGDAKARSAGGQEGEVDSLGKVLAEAAPRNPGKSLAEATFPNGARHP